MEPLPSDVARLVLGYLSDTCPAAAAQFLAKSPDLEEVRRMRPRAQRPFGPSLVDLLTEHATADSLVEDADSAMKWSRGSVGGGGFLHKLRRLLALITGEIKGGAVVPGAGSADTLPGQSSHPDGVGGVWPDREAATAGHWSAEPEPTDAGEWDEAPAVGGDCADTPAAEAGGSPGRWEGVGDSSHKPESDWDSAAPGDSPDASALATEFDSSLGVMDGGKTRPGAGSTVQTELNSATKSQTKDDTDAAGRSVEKTDGQVSSSGGDSKPHSGSGGNRPAASNEDGRRRRKGRPPRRSDPEKLAVQAGNSTGGQPLGWVFGQVRHCSSSGRPSTTSVNQKSSQRHQQREERSEPEPAVSAPYDDTTSAGQTDGMPPSPLANDLTQSLAVCPSASSLPPSSTTCPPTTQTSSSPRPAAPAAAPAGPISTAPAVVQPALPPAGPSDPSVGPAGPSTAGGGRHSARKKSMPRRRRTLEECGTIVVRPGAIRSGASVPQRSTASGSGPGSGSGPMSGTGSGVRLGAETASGGLGVSVSAVKEGGVIESSVETRLPEPHAGGDYSSNEDRIRESSEQKAQVSESPTKHNRVSRLPAESSRTAAMAERPIPPLSVSRSGDRVRPPAPPSPLTARTSTSSRLRSPSPGAAPRLALVTDSDSCQSPALEVDTSAASSPTTSVTSGAPSYPPDADSSDAFSPPMRGFSSRLRPSGGADVGGGVYPSPSQLSGRSSQLSGRCSQLSGRCSQLSDGTGRSTPISQRSLRICLTPTSVKTPSVSGSLRADETPTSVRQSARRGGVNRPGSGRISAPRRRLLAGLRGRSESPQVALDLSRPSAQSTPSAAAAAAPVGSEPATGAGGAAVSGDCSPVVGLRRTPRRTVRRAGPLASSDPSGRSGLTRAEKRPLHPPTADRSPSPPLKTPRDDNNRSLLKSIDIMSFLSRIHRAGGD